MTTLSRRHLADAVASAAHGDYVRLEIDAATLLVVGADATVTTATWVSARHPLDVVAHSATLPTKLLLSSVKVAPDGDVELTLSERGAKLAAPGYRAEVIAAGRVPALVDVPESAWQELPGAAAMRAALLSVAPAMLQDPSRPAVSGVRFDDGAVVAQDGARLDVVWAQHGLTPFTLPAVGVDAVLHALTVEVSKAAKTPKPKKGEAAASVPPVPTPPRHRVAVGQNFVAVETTQTDPAASYSRRLTVVRRAPEPYSQWRRVLEGLSDVSTAALSRDVLLGALKGLPADAVTLSWDGGATLTVDYVVTDDTSTRRLGGGSVEVAVLGTTSTTSTASVKVATRYLLDAVKSCGDEVTLSHGEGQPLRVRSGDFEAVVMWMR